MGGGGGGGQQSAKSIGQQALSYNAATAGLQQGMNTINQSNAFGSSTYSQNGNMEVTLPDGSKVSVPKYQQKTTLSAPMQQAFDQSTTGMNDRLAQFNGQGRFNGDQAMEDKISGLQRQRLDPYWKNQQEQFDAKMAGQGIAPGSEAYRDAYSNFSQGQNDSYNSMWLGAHNDAYNQAKDEYNMPLQQAGQLQQIAQGTNPTFGTVPQTGVNGIDFAGLASAQNANNQSGNNAFMGGLFGLGSAALGLL